MKKKLIDPHLRKVLQDFSCNYLVKRENVLRGYDFDALRTTLAEVKDRALGRSAELLAEFTRNASAHGSQVLRAADSAEANRLILDICRTHGVRSLVKSKSMVSEETCLNAFLAAHGIAAHETDLGEWIVQLAAERPTHMVMPAIHLTRRDVARLFSEKLGRLAPEEIPALVRIAREEIRRKIFNAEAGLTGANALIADSGALMLLTNEGNGRLVSSVPPVHIVLASIEKTLPTVAEALLLLQLLPRNATGQAITSYVSFIAGPHAAAQYIILLDNHRSAILADPQFRSVLRCIKCSACLNVCPVYRLIGGEHYSHIYMGGIGTLLTAWINGLKESQAMAGLCLRCHRCEDYCATKIPIADLITALAGRLNDAEGAPLWKRIVLGQILPNPKMQRTTFHIARQAGRALRRRDGFSRRLPPWMRKYDRFRALPAPAQAPFSQLFRQEFPPRNKTSIKGSLTIFAGCLVEYFYPEIGLAAGRVLTRLGYAVMLAPASCCGFPSLNAGFPQEAKTAFERVVGESGSDGLVITLCPTCTVMLAKSGPGLLAPGKARALAERVTPFSKFLVETEKEAVEALFRTEAGAAARSPAGTLKSGVTYHESCHHKYLLTASSASRWLVEKALGGPLVEMEGSEQCCGFAGSFSIENPEISEALLADKLAAIEKTGAGIVALDCPGCLLQIRGGCQRRRGLGVRVRHTAEILDEASRL